MPTTTNYPARLSALFLTREDRLEDLQRQLEEIQDQIFLLSMHVNPDIAVSKNG